ncbi:MAG: porin [Mucilaginibacter sp.]|nr:porin [Mucilaginibacter sp.]
MKAIRGNVKALTKLCVITGILSANHAAMAQTNVQVYGLLDTYVGSIKRSDQAQSTTVVNGGGTATSYWGIRGTEDLGGSLKAIFVLESFFQSDTGTQGRNATDPFFSKDSFVGLSGSLGQITMGRHTLPVFNALVAGNPFGGSLQLSPVMLQTWLPTFGRNVAGDSKWDNSVQYKTPIMSGFQGTVIAGAGETAGHNGTGNVGLSGAYAQGPLSATLVVQKTRVGTGLAPVTPQQSVVMGGGTYNFGMLKLYGTYYQTQIPVSDIRDKTAQLGVAVPIGAGKISASWANSRISARGVADVSRNGFSTGYEHGLSPTTALYAIYMYDKLNTSGSAGSVAFGMRHTF